MTFVREARPDEMGWNLCRPGWAASVTCRVSERSCATRGEKGNSRRPGGAPCLGPTSNIQLRLGAGGDAPLRGGSQSVGCRRGAWRRGASTRGRGEEGGFEGRAAIQFLEAVLGGNPPLCLASRAADATVSRGRQRGPLAMTMAPPVDGGRRGTSTVTPSAVSRRAPGPRAEPRAPRDSASSRLLPPAGLP